MQNQITPKKQGMAMSHTQDTSRYWEKCLAFIQHQQHKSTFLRLVLDTEQLSKPKVQTINDKIQEISCKAATDALFDTCDYDPHKNSLYTYFYRTPTLWHKIFPTSSQIHPDNYKFRISADDLDTIRRTTKPLRIHSRSTKWH